ncbi:hypothetical protein H6P81_017589 [Aristolochia fimbriata]|uniref:Uncharacterized protein n=1 Tax=Aristolochia fimbriata TaxID=158543 RepID=A0AAV7DYK3_ARIFI|nr:hypothetical protein H6P81_017589 [Aristolochia fimbriata]
MKPESPDCDADCGLYYVSFSNVLYCDATSSVSYLPVPEESSRLQFTAAQQSIPDSPRVRLRKGSSPRRDLRRVKSLAEFQQHAFSKSWLGCTTFCPCKMQ